MLIWHPFGNNIVWQCRHLLLINMLDGVKSYNYESKELFMLVNIIYLWHQTFSKYCSHFQYQAKFLTLHDRFQANYKLSQKKQCNHFVY